MSTEARPVAEEFDPAVTDLVARMTPAEKAALCAGSDFWHLYGVPRLDVPPIMVADGPYGLRKEHDGSDVDGKSEPATCFPTSSALAASWDPDLVEEVGRALGDEARANDVSVLLGPGVNIKRSPLCGRNFEYFSEDPLLAGLLGAAWIRGVQSRGVGASLKHFAANNQERRRFNIDAAVDERALHEIYLTAFELAVTRARPWTVMCAYNRLNGVHCSQHEWLLTTVLRERWGFDGLVVSDWGAVDERVPGLAAGLDVEMPGYGGHNDRLILDALADGTLPEAVLDRAAARVLTLIERTAQVRAGGHGYDRDAHHALARRAATEGTVLLKNEGGLLPLAPQGRIAVVGAFARQPRFQGAGSAGINPHRVDDAYTRICELAGEQVAYAPGYHRDRGEVDEELLAQARATARDADVVLVFVGLTEGYETEGLDRTHLALPAAHDALVHAVTAVHDKAVVVLANGAPVEMPWLRGVPAVVEGYLGGQAGGSAVADVLFGAAEPGGRLAETFPHRWEDNPTHAIADAPAVTEYRESVYVGYRYYDSAHVDVMFPFGHGLSYTTFAYSGLALDAAVAEAGQPVQVSVTVTNTGEREGSEVVQVYVHDCASTVFRPQQELAGFAKVRLRPGQSQQVAVELDRRAFAYYDTGRGDWSVEAGRFEIRVGSSSRDIRAVAVLDLTGGDPAPEPSAYPLPAPGQEFDRTAFADLYGRPLPANTADRPGAFTLNTPLADMRSSLVTRTLQYVARRKSREVIADPTSPMAYLVAAMLDEMPLRMLALGTRGAVSRSVQQGLLDLINGRRLRGLRGLLSSRGR
ncbi:glycoside hydrolase family 3 C-terminal domain-containing protein [Catellatospora sp. KI3]|uniref:glycoside hydrolase family 3 C-terminal domain-containing protein n=1 Tax=Catellatospora sp. KI3 TaxID=3041620 RepID=UPI002482BAA7|nr:glycoside hydrolase family 3 C-terminal domain-containing protein [Catellatospora sp. KI3]MDI1464765.1 glycoside hydrolase family 3 C-terminal domain-containing protein [Catellatospora sp. KI3]